MSFLFLSFYNGVYTIVVTVLSSIQLKDLYSKYAKKIETKFKLESISNILNNQSIEYILIRFE